MGLFDGISQMFGTGAAAAKGTENQFGPLKQKSQSVLNALDQQGAHVNNLHMEGGKLRLFAVAPSEEAKTKCLINQLVILIMAT